jgi:hypothetical protein
MNDSEFEALCEAAREGDKDALEKILGHTHQLRDMVLELSEGLEDDGLIEQVEELVGEE